MHLTSVGCSSDGSQDLVYGSVQSLCSYWRTISSTRREFTDSVVIRKRKFGFRQIPECAILSLCILVLKVLQTEFSEITVGNNKNQVHWELNNNFESYFPECYYTMATGVLGGYVYAA